MHRSSGGRVTRVDAIHLTLAFLGDVDEGRLAVLRKLRTKGKRHVLRIDAARYHKANGMVWVGPAKIPGPLSEMVASLAAFLKSNDFRTEERPFAAHITLLRNAGVPPEIPELPRIDWRVDEMVLVRSRLSPKGSSYEVLQRYPLS